jgi:uncharacterized protein YkwD
LNPISTLPMMPRWFSHLYIGLVLLFTPVLSGASLSAASYTGCGGAAAPTVNADYEQQVVEQVNAQRWANGSLPPYKRVSPLDTSSRYHAADMGQDDYFDHATYDRVNGSLVLICSWDTRIGIYYTGVRGENIAAGQPDPTSVMAAWMGSQGHKDNILSTTSWEIGVGYYSGSGKYGSYWVQDFGKRSGVYPLVINRETAHTSSPAVSLYIYGTWTQIRLKNENGPWSSWQGFQNNITWTLSACSGTKTVSAEMQSGSSDVTSSDSIELTSSPPILIGLPDSLHFVYSIPDGRLYPPSAQLLPIDQCNTPAMPWTAAKSGNWLSLSATFGTTPAPFTVTPSGFNPSTPATYTGSVTVTGPAGAGGSPHLINLTLDVENLPLKILYLPSIFQ